VTTRQAGTGYHEFWVLQAWGPRATTYHHHIYIYLVSKKILSIRHCMAGTTKKIQWAGAPCP